jgi:hypothetical protein
MLHLICRDPARCSKLRFNLLAAHFFGDVSYAHPEHANRGGPIARLVVYGKLNFIRFVNLNVERLVLPSVGSGGFRSRLDGILYFDNDKGLRTSGEP